MHVYEDVLGRSLPSMLLQDAREMLKQFWIETLAAGLHKKPYPPDVVDVLKRASGFYQDGRRTDPDVQNTVLPTLGTHSRLIRLNAGG